MLILPRSADYSEEVWMEIREKAISILQTYFINGIVPEDAISDVEAEESDAIHDNSQFNKQEKEIAPLNFIDEQLADDFHLTPESSWKAGSGQPKESLSQVENSELSQNTTGRSEGRRSRSGKKAKKRHSHQKSRQRPDNPRALDKDSTSNREDDTAMSGTEQISSSSRFASPEDSRSRKLPAEPMQDLAIILPQKSSKNLVGNPSELLKDGHVIALYTKDHSALHVARQRVKRGGWFLDPVSNVSKRDPAAQFLVASRSKVCMLYFFPTCTSSSLLLTWTIVFHN